MRATHFKTFVIAIAIVAVIFAFSSCSVPWAKDPVEDFLGALNRQDVDAAADLTDDPAVTSQELQTLFDGLGNTTFNIKESEDESNTTIVSWTVPSGEHVDTYGVIGQSESGKMEWSPRIFDAEISANTRIIYADDKNVDTKILDRRGTVLMNWQTVTVVNASSAALPFTDEIARIVAPVVPTATSETIAEQINSGLVLFALRTEDMSALNGTLESVPGIQMREEGRLLSAGRDFSSPLDSGLSQYWYDYISQGAGWSLRAINPDGDLVKVLGSRLPERPNPISTTVDMGLQGAARRAVDSEKRAATVVAISVSTGGILAVAQNDAASKQGPIALTGLYPPGSTFKTITTAAALERGIVSLDTSVSCPASAEISGRVIPNDNDFDLGIVPMHTAFARSCNTTQGFISKDLEPDDLKNTALSFGLGADYIVPGVTTITGNVPVTDQGAARVESAIGQGEVLASPFGLALMEATLGAGFTVMPSLIHGETTTSDQVSQQIPVKVAKDLRVMMRETVTSGSARSLGDLGALGGKTGTAEVDGQPAHGWFTGIYGDVAFSVFVEGGDSSSPALAISGDFLRDSALDAWR